jgi:hypothetical protein
MECFKPTVVFVCGISHPQDTESRNVSSDKIVMDGNGRWSIGRDGNNHRFIVCHTWSGENGDVTRKRESTE